MQEGGASSGPLLRQGSDASIRIQTRGRNVLSEEGSEFANSSQTLESLTELGIRAHNPLDIEKDVVEQLETQLQSKREPTPLSTFVQKSNLSDLVGEGSEMISLKSLERLIRILESSVTNKYRNALRYQDRDALDRVEELQIKVQLLHCLMDNKKKEEEKKKEQLVLEGKQKPAQKKVALQSQPAQKKVTLPSEGVAREKKRDQVLGVEKKKKNTVFDPFKSPDPFVSRKRRRSGEKVVKLEPPMASSSSSSSSVPVKVKSEVGVETAECPLCLKKYPIGEIDVHAAKCRGTSTNPIEVTSDNDDDIYEQYIDNEPVPVKSELKRKVSSRSKKVLDDHLAWIFAERVENANNLDRIFAGFWAQGKQNGLSDEDADAFAQEKMIIVEDEDGGEGEGDSVGEPQFVVFSGGLRVARRFYCKLFEYQRTCLEWLWDLHRQGTGGILGDEMGLGKTVQIASFLGALKDSDILLPSIICCPATTIAQWVGELNKWAPRVHVLVLHASGGAVPEGGWSKQKVINKIRKSGDVVVTTYGGLRGNQDLILQRRWGYVILDEGHKIRNPDADITLVCKQVQTVHRLVMTGSPIQNNLKELWSLFDFVAPGRLGTLPMFENQFSVPINAGGYANASAMQVRMAYRCALVLKETIEPYLLRRLKKDVAQSLPQKLEQVLFCNLTKVQRDAYEKFLNRPDVEHMIQGARNGVSKKTTFKYIRALQHICNHPDLFFEKESTAGSNILSGFHQNDRSLFDGLDRDFILDLKNVDKLVKRSGKLMVLRIIMKEWKAQGHRVLLFSQGRLMLDYLEAFVKGEGYTYMRMDGTTSIKSRSGLIDGFNDKSGGVFVFLLTTKVGGLGINLIGADRVILFDPDWNPSTDIQARERAWRIGQDKQVTIYRLITSGTIEEKMYHRQIFKQYLTNKILSDPRQRRFFKYSSMRDLFTLGDAGGDDSAHERTARLSSGVRRRRRQTRSTRAAAAVEDEDEEAIREQEAQDLQAAQSAAMAANTETSDMFVHGAVDATAEEKSDENQNILQSLFDGGSGGFRQAFSHDTVEESARSTPDQRILEQEASRVARRAAAALRRDQQAVQRDNSNIHVPTWTGQNGLGGRFGGSSSTQLLAQLRQRSADPTAEIESTPIDENDPHVQLMRSLHRYLSRGACSTQDILNNFKNHPLKDDPGAFRELLRQLATCENGIWSLKDEYRN
mmetsp:Transcript_45072/g.72014  ORF Transcript_45072/g.72014 Transcript_45072/m.72014 type:complete len:1197 (-) Transcript_45072:101-3691(-)|eukprot:CAMPEP_0203746142 /NCGR_PEP_ID=MMETSP0098-20131031/1672_1 /ASSEMBLY_ACC=CAM_ASM_000208 /TAXON_ID=96639 /ORGANISM=" , Strain NY0313808BC1" /LENGTH=1196 /DNA_ID=CAMNT_0050634127 /DNA_START=561 /DNA_END=4151 /DNA_ORIENTATION=+